MPRRPSPPEVDGRPRYRWVPLPARTVMTVGPTDPAWTEGSQDLTRGAVTGAVVRVRPPADARPGQVDELVMHLRRCGALAVNVLPAEAVAVLPVGPARAPGAPRPARTLREVVLEVAAEARVDDPAALRAALEECMSEAGL